MNEQRNVYPSLIFFWIAAGGLSTFYWLMGVLIALSLGHYDDPSPWHWFYVTGIIWLVSCVVGIAQTCFVAWMVRH